MGYRAVGDRIAVDIAAFDLPIGVDAARAVLEEEQFVRIEVDLVVAAREQIGHARYQLRAHPREAPHVVNCSSFTKWLCGLRGIWLPRLAVQQRNCGEFAALVRSSRHIGRSRRTSSPMRTASRRTMMSAGLSSVAFRARRAWHNRQPIGPLRL